MPTYSHYINNHWIPGEGDKLLSTNPATGEVLFEGHSATTDEVESAVDAAREAFPNWAATPVEKRIEYAEAFQQILAEKREELAEIISKETGKPLWESMAEINAMIGKVRISKDAYYDRCKEMTRQQGNSQAITRHKPHGVIAVFGPFNFPGHIPNGHIIPALIAGNTVVFKPSEMTPLVAEMLLHYWVECHLPKGVINLVQGQSETGKTLANAKDIDGLFFTGSSETGQQLSEYFGKHPEKILALEMGGNNPYIIGNVSDYKQAAYLTMMSAFITAGQRCTCARRLIIPTGAPGDDFLAEFIPMVENLKVGPYTDDPEPFMGPVISNSTAEKLLKAQEEMKGDVLLKMKRLSKNRPFLSPGIIDVTEAERVRDQELFGPLLQVIRVPDFSAAIDEANNTAYGLAAGVLTDDADQYQEFFANARAGCINWNTQLTGASSQSPFGGVGKSGNHRPSAYYAADYCSYPVASLEAEQMQIPETLPPGVHVDR